MKIGVVTFPGTNCDQDAVDAIEKLMGGTAISLWHNNTELHGVDAIILPGGFSYGDYLRSGALARFSPVLESITTFANSGKPVIGICNGFQVLTECGLLPGALTRNRTLSFVCDRVEIIVERNDTPFTSTYQAGQRVMFPIAHADGNYYADPDTLKRLEDKGQVVFRYANDVNGSLNQIAGICNARRNVVGLMPHPERNLWPSPNSSQWNGDGRGVFDALKETLQNTLASV